MEYEFKPKEWVLTRDDDDEEWTLNIFSHKSKDYFHCVSSMWEQCLPYEGNEHLLGTSDSPEEKPEKEEFKFGDKVKCWTCDDEWVDGLFVMADDSTIPYLVYLPEENDTEWCRRKDLRHA